MLEDETTNDVVEETVVDEPQVVDEPAEEEHTEPADKREGVLDYITGALKAVKDKVIPEREEEPEEQPIRDSAQEVPVAFSEAAKMDGWSSTDIIEFAAQKTDEELLELIPHLQQEEEEEEQPIETEEPEKAQLPVSEELEAFKSSIREELRKELLQEYGSKLEVLEDFRANQDRRQKMEFFETANDLMDEASKDLSVFGTFEEIPRFSAGPRKGEPVPTSPAYKARSPVFNLAANFLSTGRSDSVKDAMDDALAWYRGKYGQKETERKVIRNLKQHQTKLSGARTGKEVKREFGSSRDEILDYIESSQRAARR